MGILIAPEDERTVQGITVKVHKELVAEELGCYFVSRQVTYIYVSIILMSRVVILPRRSVSTTP